MHSVRSSPIYNSQDMEASWMSIDSWMYKEDVVRIHNEILLCHKKEQIWVSSSEVDEPRACYTLWNKLEKEKYIYTVLIPIYGI